MPGVTVCDRARGDCQSVAYVFKKIHIQILGSVNCKNVLPTRFLLGVVTNHTITHFQRYSNPSPSAVRH